MPSILLTNYYSLPIREIILNNAPDGFKIVFIDKPIKEAILEKVSNADYLLVGGRTKIDLEVINAAAKLKMVQRTGVGLDSIDIKYLQEKGIPIYVNSGVNAKSVSEYTIMLILSVLRNLIEADSLLKSGIWRKHEFGINNYELYGKTVGLIGLGNIGEQVAKILRPFGVNIIYHKRNRLSEDYENRLDIKYKEFEDLLQCSDIISLHCSLNNSTNKLLDEREFSLMKNGVIIINTSRGKLINEKALIRNLISGKIRGAGLDVFENEPLSENSELYKLKNVIITPHISGITYESFSNMFSSAFNNIHHFENGDYELIKEKLIINE